MTPVVPARRIPVLYVSAEPPAASCRKKENCSSSPVGVGAVTRGIVVPGNPMVTRFPNMALLKTTPPPATLDTDITMGSALATDANARTATAIRGLRTRNLQGRESADGYAGGAGCKRQSK